MLHVQNTASDFFSSFFFFLHFGLFVYFIHSLIYVEPDAPEDFFLFFQCKNNKRQLPVEAEAQTMGIVVAIAFVYRVVSAGTQRQTNTQTQTRVLQGLAFIQQPTFIRDQFKAL